MGQFSGTHILQTTELISFKFGMYGHIYGEHKICEFDRNRSSGYRDTRVENGELVVPINNTLVHHITFLAADTRPCVLMHRTYLNCRNM